MKKIMLSLLCAVSIAPFIGSMETEAAGNDRFGEEMTEVQELKQSRLSWGIIGSKKKYFTYTTTTPISYATPGTMPFFKETGGYMYSGTLDYHSERVSDGNMITKYAGYITGYKYGLIK